MDDKKPGRLKANSSHSQWDDWQTAFIGIVCLIIFKQDIGSAIAGVLDLLIRSVTPWNLSGNLTSRDEQEDGDSSLRESKPLMITTEAEESSFQQDSSPLMIAEETDDKCSQQESSPAEPTTEITDNQEPRSMEAGGEREDGVSN